MLVAAIIDVFIYGIAACALLWACYLVVMPLAAMFSKNPSSAVAATSRHPSKPRIAVVIPAHNMEACIVECISALQNAEYPHDRLRVHVIADHCSDETRRVAQETGATVLTRHDGAPGKTYALAWALAQLSERPDDLSPDLYVVVDATARVSTRFFDAISTKWQQGEEIVVGRAVIDPDNRQWFARCMGLTLTHRGIQNLARERLGLSSLIEGRAMAYSGAYIAKHGWRNALPDSTAAIHPTEDWRHGVKAVESGHRVSYAKDAVVYTPLRDSLGAATRQGVRWERGRLENAGTHAIRFLLTSTRGSNRLLFFSALDAVQPPVAVVAGVAILIALAGGLLSGSEFAQIFALTPAALTFMYGGAVVYQGRKDGIHPANLLWAPVYIGWRCLAFLLACSTQAKTNASHQGRGRP